MYETKISLPRGGAARPLGTHSGRTAIWAASSGLYTRYQLAGSEVMTCATQPNACTTRVRVRCSGRADSVSRAAAWLGGLPSPRQLLVASARLPKCDLNAREGKRGRPAAVPADGSVRGADPTRAKGAVSAGRKSRAALAAQQCGCGSCL